MKKQTVFAVLASVVMAVSILTAVPMMSGTAYARSMFIPYANNTMCPVTGTRIGRSRFYSIAKGKRWSCASREAADELKRNPDKYLTREFLAKI